MILVAGATGRVGGMITRALLERAFDTRILVRRGSAYHQLAEAGADIALGDVKDPGSLADACREVETIITTATAGERTGADTPQTVDLEGNRNLIEAAGAAGVRQFIFVSTIAAAPDHPVPVPRAKAYAEARLRESGLTYTIIAANAIMDVMFPLVIEYPLSRGRPVTLVGEGRRRHSFVAARDVAAFAVAAVGHPEASNRRIIVGGPEALSWRDVISAYERARGAAVRVEWIRPGEPLPDLPPAPGVTELVSGLLAALETFDSPVDMAQTARAFGVRPTTVDQMLAGDRIDAARALRPD